MDKLLALNLVYYHNFRGFRKIGSCYSVGFGSSTLGLSVFGFGNGCKARFSGLLRVT